MRVLIAYDASDCSHAALELAARLPWSAPTRLTILSVVEEHRDVFGAADGVLIYPVALPTDSEIAAEVAQQLAEAAAKLKVPGRTVDTIVAHGRPASVIVDKAAELAVDVIVVGSRGFGPWSTLLLGSVSTEVVDHAPCPVLVARHGRVDRLVVGVDGSSSANLAIGAISGWHVFTGLPAEVITVVDQRPTGADWAVLMASGYADDRTDARGQQLQGAREQAERAAERLRSAGISARASVAAGDPAQELVRAATLENDLVVMGSRGLAMLPRLLLGSVARKVLLHTEGSVLIVREPHARATEDMPARAPAALAF